MALAGKSAIYFGSVYHRRLLPREHSFRYRLAMFYLDLGHLESSAEWSFFFSNRLLSLFRFKSSDYLPNVAGISLTDRVRSIIKKERGQDFSGPIFLLTQVRHFGYAMNPISIFYCFDHQQNLCYLLAEVTNTPWGERHTYLIPAPSKQDEDPRCEKDFHVSPFLDMNFSYRWQISAPGSKLQLSIANYRQETKWFKAGIDLERRDLSRLHLCKMLVFYPFTSLKIIAAIYLQALFLFIKRIPFVPHPGAAKEKKTGGKIES